MTNGEIRDAMMFGCLVLFVLLLLWRTRNQVPAVPPVVSPQSMPIEEQMRDVRHRTANLEQVLPQIADHGARLRSVEQVAGDMRAKLDGLTQGQTRIEGQLNMIIAHHIEKDARS